MFCFCHRYVKAYGVLLLCAICILIYNNTINSGTSSNHWTKASSYQQEEEGGFFAKRFGIVKQKEHNTAGRRSDGFLGNGTFSHEHSNGDYICLAY